MRRVYPRATAPPNKPLQQPNARVVRLAVRLCRDGAGCARASSLRCYARGDRSAFAAERQIVRQRSPMWKLILLILVTGCSTTRQLPMVIVAPEPAQYAWWLRIEFRPMDRTIQGIPIGELDPTWRFASELRKELIPRELLFKGGSDEMDDNQLAFTRLGDFDQNGTEDLALVGVSENRRGERGNFVLILTRTAAGAWQKLFITALPGRAGFAALAQRSDDL